MEGKDVVKRHDNMGEMYRGNWTRLWQECADWCMPTQDNINRVRSPGLEKTTQRMIDSCIDANFNFASGFFSNMFPPNSIWARYRHPNPNLMSNQKVADYFEEVSRIAHGILIGSNFSQEEFQALLCMGAFGTNCMSIEEDDQKIVRFRNFTVGNIRMEQNYLGMIDTVSREFELNARQAVQQFGIDVFKGELSKVLDDAKNQRETKYTFIHLVCPREEYDDKKKDSKNKPYASYYVIKGHGDKIVKEGGFDYNPYTASRFTVGNGEVYGRSPMSMVLSTTRMSNAVFRAGALAIEQSSHKMLLVPSDDSVKMPRRRAIDLIKWDPSSPNGAPQILQPENPHAPFEFYELLERKIKTAFFNHLFKPLEDYRNMTAWEAQERTTTDMMALAPFTSRYQDEHVNPIMNTLFYIMQKRKLLPPMPQELLDDPRYNVDYVGRLALVTKNFETMGAVNAMRVFGELSQMSPEFATAFDNVDPDKAFKQLWYSMSGSMNALRDIDEVADKRQAEAEAMAQQQQIDAAPALADATQKLSGAVDPNSPLAQMAQQ